MKKQINTAKAPAAIGPYSQGQIIGDLVFTSGQIPLVPETMVFVEGGIKEQSIQSLTNLKEVLLAAGADLDSVIKTTCFLANMDDFATFNAVYVDFFGENNAPARSCVAVKTLPKGALVEVEAIAYVKK